MSNLIKSEIIGLTKSLNLSVDPEEFYSIMDTERLDMAQLTSDKDLIKAHNTLLDCAWEIVDFSCTGGIFSISYENKNDELEIVGTRDNLLFKMNDEDAKELTEDNLIRTILF